MKDWKRSPEPPSMMGPPLPYSAEPFTNSETSGTYPETAVAVASTSVLPSTITPRQRTKVDTSLLEMSKKIILQRIHLFDTFGSTPFPLVRTILEQCTAKKLWALEEESPHLLPHTGYIWKRHSIRDFKDISQKAQSGLLEEADDWRSLYWTRYNEQQEALEAAAARVKEKYASLEASRVATRMRVVAELPEMRGKANKFRNVSSGSNMTTGQKLLNKARKQGNARLQMTTGIRKAGLVQPSSSPPSLAKKPRMEEAKRSATQIAPEYGMPSQDSGSISPVKAMSPSSKSSRNNNKNSNIFNTKRRIANGGPSSAN